MLGAVMEAHRSFQPVIDAIIALAEHCAKDPLPLTDPSEASKTVAAKLKADMRARLVDAFARDAEAGPPGQDRRRESGRQEAVRR